MARMGMFDSFYVLDDTSQFLCAGGHHQKGVELQSKSLGCLMDIYYVREGMLYVLRREDDDNAQDIEYNIVDAGLLIVRREVAKRHGLNQTVTMYTSCMTCDPVVFEHAGSGHWDGKVGERSPRVELDVTFTDGRVTKVVPNGCETREEVRKELLASGVLALPDDDRIAKRHIELLRERTGRFQI